ncbi:MAG: D-alanine--D-alanine ligase [Chloroflexi bacterium]|nr:D-alanine--D-alanine ligase [Chloroflexota bacterium]
MINKTRVGVVFGGRSGEHEVSLVSARSIMSALDPKKYESVPIGITHSGRWLMDGDPMAALSAGTAAAEDAAALTVAGPPAGGRELVPGATGQALPPLDVIFPVLHGPFGEDGTLQGLLELAGAPYVGCGVLASALGMDKIACKEVWAAHGLPIGAWCAARRREWEADPDAVIAAVEAALRYPVFVKPANLGSSIGISKARNREELRLALADAARYDRRLLVEEAVPQAREIECAILGNDDPIASVPGEVVPSHEFYDYAAKYLDGNSRLLIPAPLPSETAARVRDLAVRAFKALDGAGLARVDFLMDGITGKMYINEVNTMPGFTTISMYPKLWEASGIPYTELVERLIDLALERHADRSRSMTTYSGALKPGQP